MIFGSISAPPRFITIPPHTQSLTMAATRDGEEKVLATAQHIVKSLHSSTDGNADDIILLFSTIDPRFANLSNLMHQGSSVSNPSTPSAAAAAAGSPSSDSSPSVIVGGGGEDDEDSCNSSNNQSNFNLDAAEDLINRWESAGDGEGIENYLDVVDRIIGLTEQLGLEDDEDVAERAETTLQQAMVRLEEEFVHTLTSSTIPFDDGRIDGLMNKMRRSFLSSSSYAGDSDAIPYFDSGFDPDEGSSGRYHRRVTCSSLGGDELFLDLVNPDAMDDLKAIATRMIRAGYEKECCQAYSNVRREVLEECMSIIQVEKLSIEEVQRMDWKLLNEKIKKWIRSLKIVVRVLLTGEKRLCVDIFPASDVVADVCFVEATKGCVMQILNFGEAVAIGRRSVEKLSRILDMFDALCGVLPDFQELYTDKEAGDMLCTEAQGVLDGLREAAIGTFVEFENAVQGETSRTAIPNGEIHPLTRYVMNYVRLLADYRPILNTLFENGEEPDQVKSVRDTDSSESETNSPTALRMLSLIKSLEKNLEEKARMYEDGGLQFVFLMNNILYIVQKVKDSELRNLLGDNWIRRHRGQIRQYSTSYLRASWTRVLSFLKDEGIGAITNNASKVVLKERFKSFNACFEDIYRIQTAWKVPDMQLRDELKISISEKLIPAYRSFMGRFGSHIESGKHAGKYIKYTSEDLDFYVSHLFEGAPLVLHHVRRKSG